MKRVLYLGLDPSHHSDPSEACEIVHWPIIRIVPIPLSENQVNVALRNFEQYTHLIFTSKSAVPILKDYLHAMGKNWHSGQPKVTLAVGKVTAAHLTACGLTPTKVALNETAEGIVELLEELVLEGAHVFWPHSNQARNVIPAYLQTRGVAFCACPLYFPEYQALSPLPQLDSFQEIVFTSPSTVKAFLQVFGGLPENMTLKAIGPVTQAYLNAAH
jgi:uroporphyrinogen-III synthase